METVNSGLLQLLQFRTLLKILFPPTPLFSFSYGRTGAELHNEAKRFHLGMSHRDLRKHNWLHKQPLIPQFTRPFLLKRSNPQRVLFCTQTATKTI